MNYLGLESKGIEKVSKELNTILSCYHVYYQNLRNFHWNVEGKNFFDMHHLFEDMYNDAKVKIDEIAERILTIRQKPLANMSDYLEHSKVKEATYSLSDEDMIKTILKDHQQIIWCMRNAIKAAEDADDQGSIDLLAGFLANLEKRSWMLDAWQSKKFIKEMA
jgi:starvation-inducible DNA-binding protein